MISEKKRFEKLQQRAIVAGVIVGVRPSDENQYFMLNIAQVNNCKKTGDIGTLEQWVEMVLQPQPDGGRRY